jgi:hypothetical protein
LSVSLKSIGEAQPSSSDDGDGSGASVPQFEVIADFDYQVLMAQPLIALFIYLSGLGFLDGLPP